MFFITLEYKILSYKVLNAAIFTCLCLLPGSHHKREIVTKILLGIHHYAGWTLVTLFGLHATMSVGTDHRDRVTSDATLLRMT